MQSEVCLECEMMSPYNKTVQYDATCVTKIHPVLAPAVVSSLVTRDRMNSRYDAVCGVHPA